MQLLLLYGLIFFITITSAIMSSKTFNTLCFFLRLYSSIFSWTPSISLEYSIKALRSSQWFKPNFSRLLIKYWHFALYGSFAYRYALSISGWLLIKSNNAFVFPDLEPPIINILYGWSGIYGHFQLCYILFSFV